MKHYYLNDLCNSNLWNVGRFDYASAIIKNIFLFIKQTFLHHFFLFPASKGHNENKAIRLFCVILAVLFSISLIILLTSTFFYLWLSFLFFFFFKVWLFNFFLPIRIFCFLWQNKTYLLTYQPTNTDPNDIEIIAAYIYSYYGLDTSSVTSFEALRLRQHLNTLNVCLWTLALSVYSIE